MFNLLPYSLNRLIPTFTYPHQLSPISMKISLVRPQTFPHQGKHCPDTGQAAVHKSLALGDREDTRARGKAVDVAYKTREAASV